jgi:hypothetical protein
MGTEIDCLAVEDCFLVKEAKNPALRQRHHQSLELD